MFLRRMLIVCAAASAIAGCMHHGSEYVSSGDVTIDSLSATRTAILRIQNNYPTEIRVYTVIDGKANYVAKAMPGEVRSWVLDPNLFPASAISLEARTTDKAMRRIVGPYKVQRGETVDVVVPATFSEIKAEVHRTLP